ncbi:MAG: DUF169 domain-containing protein [Methanomassiliicoccaceae archaeon]|jgi:uncharacterized protein (DUF169 family)|nr:DUF169 domain-containing protein [Methanomassiliicoccaceae archaeon]
MSSLKKNEEASKMLKTVLELRYEPVAVKLVRENEEYPKGYPVPEKQLSYCQSVMQARHGNKFMMPLDSHMCNVGASFIGMMDKPPKVASGEFHFTMGIHDTVDAVKKMIDEAASVPFKTKGTVVCPLKDANFEPDVVIFVDIPERIYWFAPLFTSKTGGRVGYTTAPFQAACVDATATPVKTGVPNISLGCMGCRKKTDLKMDELMIGIPGALIYGMAGTLERYKADVMPKANRTG